jgi:hypothetical protein
MFVDTGQTFGDNTSPSNFEAVPNCRSQHAQALWHRPDTIAWALPLLPAIAHQDPPTLAGAASFVQANCNSLNPGALDALGNRRPPRTVTTWTTAFTPILPSTSFVPSAPAPLLYTNRWIRPYFFSVQNTIRAALTTKWKKIQGYYTHMGIAKVKAKYDLPKKLERCLLPLSARDKALLLWHSKATFAIPAEVKQDLALIQGWLKMGVLCGTLDSTRPNLRFCG